MTAATKALASPATVLYLRQGSFFFSTAAITMIGITILIKTTNIGENKWVKKLWGGKEGDSIGILGVAYFCGAITLNVVASLLDDPLVTNLGRRMRITMLAVIPISIAVLCSVHVLKNRGWIADGTKDKLQWIFGVALVAIPVYVIYRGSGQAPGHFISKTYHGIKSGIGYVASRIFKRGG